MHCLALGCPIAGDGLYTPSSADDGAGESGEPGDGGPTRLHLHCSQLGFHHPGNGEWQVFYSEPPFSLVDALPKQRAMGKRTRPGEEGAEAPDDSVDAGGARGAEDGDQMAAQTCVARRRRRQQ